MLKLQYVGYLMDELTHWKRPDAGKGWKGKVKGVAEDEMAR